MEHTNPELGSDLIADVEAKDKRTVTIKTSHPYSLVAERLNKSAKNHAPFSVQVSSAADF